jgi:hypothetical protein
MIPMPLSRLFLFVFFILISGLTLAQPYQVKGKVVDSKTKEPLAFVNITINDGRYGGTTDIDGVFSLHSNQKIHLLNFSYIGYEALYQPVYDSKNLFVELKSRSVELEEVLILPGINPAHRIIKNVVRNREINDPEKLDAFSYTAYDKMVVTSDVDSVVKAQSMWDRDTSLNEAKKFFEKKDLFLMESVIDRKFMKPDRNYEHVIAQRVSGFKDPIFTFLLSQVQSTSFYKPLISLLGKNYVNPISKGSTNKYIFIIKDTTYSAQGDSIFMISFQPKFGSNFDGLSGVLAINSNQWAIQNVRAQPTAKNEIFTLKIQQLYELVDDKQWFPKQLNTDVVFDQEKAVVTTNTNDSIKENDRQFSIIAKGKSYLMNIHINPELVKREFSNVAVELAEEANDRSEEFWTTHRGDSLSRRDQSTYQFMDSIGEEENFDQVAQKLQVMLRGKIPMGKLDLDASRFIDYNDYEGFRFGLGLSTNYKFSKVLKLGGYLAYGLKDKEFKYRADASIIIDKYREVEFGISKYQDVFESGGVHFFDDKPSIFDLSSVRTYLITRMNFTKGESVYFQFRALRDFKFNIGLNSYSKKVFGDYAFDSSDGLGHSIFFHNETHAFTDLSIGFRWAFKEKFFKRKDVRMSLGTKFPIVHFNFTRGLSGFLGGNFTYNRFDLRVEKTFYTKYIGETTFRLQAGYIDSDLPYSNLYNGIGSYKPFTIYAPYSFSTMRMNEFLSDEYISLFLTHSFGELLLNSERFSPEFVLATNIGFGNLKSIDRHFMTASTGLLNKGYFESGVLINDLINLQLYTLGIGVYYRYGHYALPKTMDNFAFKFTIKFALGL